jgi:mycothiol conjugate amidase Mca
MLAIVTDAPVTLMAVLAHPDDEVWMGATLAKYADQGVRTILVTATHGEEGEIRDPDLDPDEARDRLSEIREGELRRSAQVLGLSELYFLDYRDSGMAGTPANDDPRNFHNADLEEAVCRLVHIIRRERPQVIICDNERGTYGHPDHLAAHRTTVAAFDAAGDPQRCRESNLQPWQPKKLYYSAFARSDFIRMGELLRERGVSWGNEEDAEQMLEITVPDELISTRVDVGGYQSRVREAMLAHRTQIAPDDPWVNMPEELAAEMQPTNAFTRVRSLVDTPVPEDDLFAGLRAV